MNLSHVIENTQKLLKSNSPTILTGVAVGGVVVTAVVTAKATFKAVDRIVDEERNYIHPSRLEDETPKDRVVRRVKLVWPCYVPAVVSGGLTIAAVVGSHHISSKRIAAAATAYSLSERAFAEYKAKIVEQIGENKEQKVRDEIAQDQVRRYSQDGVAVEVKQGDVLVCELWTGRFFSTTREKLDQAVNKINSELNLGARYVELFEFYDMVGLGRNCAGIGMGWSLEYGDILSLKYSSTLDGNDNPCLSFNYSHLQTVYAE